MDTLQTNNELNSEVKDELQQKSSQEQVGNLDRPALVNENNSKDSIISKLKELSLNAENASKQELDSLKFSFYKIVNAENDEAKKKFVEAGNDEDAFMPQKTEEEETFKAIMSQIRDKKKELAEKLELEKEENYKTKLAIIEEIKELIESGDTQGKSYNEFKKIQQQWNDIKLVPQNKANELWSSYHSCVEQFYDLLKLNSEFREYDFKKNLELKTKLCETAEKLSEEEDVVSAFFQLQNLHQEFREIGPVAKELRDEVWSRFKKASTLVNKKYQNYYQTLRANEQVNLDKKTALCEIVEGMDLKAISTAAEWEEKTKEIITLQEKWREIGFAPQKHNNKIYERFRTACSEFFKEKTNFFKSLKSDMATNLRLKEQLCEQAEALKDSTDWNNTANVLIKLQKDWKKIGYVGKKHSDEVWKRFVTACDYFFEQKAKATSSQKNVEVENLAKKQEIIDSLDNAFNEIADDEELLTFLKNKMNDWNKVGFVPIKQKDKIYKKYNAIVTKIYDRLNVSSANRKLTSFADSLSGKKEEGVRNLYKEKDRLLRIHNNIKNEIITYENNLCFLTSSSKKGNNLLNEVNRKLERLKADLELTQQKINLVDEELSKDD